MKKLIMVLAVAAIGCAVIWAEGFLGLNANIYGIGFTGGAESAQFGIEASVTAPLNLYFSSLDEYYNKKGTEDEIEFPSLISLVMFPFISANGYWKIADGKFFTLNLGIKVDAVLAFDGDVTMVGTWGPSLAAGFKLSDILTLSLTGVAPATMILERFDEDMSKYGIWFATTDKSEDADSKIMIIMFSVPASIVNVSLKWTL
ncbi:MAG: hypothetical protein H6546_08895 [Chitinophagales bacterium]|jgi:hypothetical protein|nr:hypothetical protein [Chitinophagales bacterium]